MNTTNIKPNVKPDRLVKPFKLLDFHLVSEMAATKSNDSSDSSEDDSSSTETSEFKRSDYVKQEPPEFKIQMFGVNEKGETASILVSGFHPFFFIKVPETGWNGSVHDAFVQHLSKTIGQYHAKSILRCELVQQQKLYGFTAGKTFPFIKMTFRNMQAFNKVKNLWYKNGADGNRKLTQYKFDCNKKRYLLDIYESFIPPLLRYFHIHNISPSGWVKIPANCLNAGLDKTTTCTYEYNCKVGQIKPDNDKETPVPYKICSFDIEADSSHGDFPLPVKTYKRLAIQIVDYIDRQKSALNSDLNEMQVSVILRNSILAGFGHKTVSGIDRVYPKRDVNKAMATRYADRMAKEPLGTLISEEDEDLTYLARANTVISAFERMAAADNNNNNNNNNDDGDEEDFDAEEEAEAEVEELDEHQEMDISTSNLLRPNPGVKYTCIEILLDKIPAVNTRELKIREITQTLDRLCPPLEGDRVSFIGSTFLTYGQTEPYMNHCLVVGSCDPVPGAVIECAETERDLLMRWRDLIERENPDIIIGYNIFGFDYEFLFRRSEELGCSTAFSMLSRVAGHKCLKTSFGTNPTDSLECTSVKLASGEYNLRYYGMVGRLQLDLYAYFRRDYNFSSYKLDDVAGQLIGDDIKKVEYGADSTILYTKNLTGLHDGDYIHLEKTTFTVNPYKGGAKFPVLKILYDNDSKPTGIVIPGKELLEESQSEGFKEKKFKLRWSVAKDDVTPQDIFRLTKGTAADRAVVAKYCIQDCNLVHHLMRKVDVLTGFIEMSKICSVPVSFLILRGQGIKLTSFVAKKCREKNTLMPDLQKTPSAGYEGAIVLAPKCGMYIEDSVACVDYASLYPSGMISQNLSHDTKVWTKEYDLEGRLLSTKGDLLYDNLPQYQYIDIEFDTYEWRRDPEKPQQKARKIKVGKQVCRWAQGVKGIMPSILEELLQARATTRKSAKAEKDPFMQNVLDKRQLGYKVTANSLYGQCGATTSTFHERDVAASTTATGRLMITYAKRMIEEVYGDLVYESKNPEFGRVLCSAEYVYGDTDSVFFTFRLKDPVTREPIRGPKELALTIEIAQDVAKLCTQWLKPPMELTYEKTLKPFFLLSKKRYVGTLYEDEPTNGKLKFMGLSLKRRDTCDFVKDIYGGVLNILMDDDHDVGKALQFLEREMERLIRGDTSWDKLMLTKALRSDYKKPEQIAHRVLAERIGQRDPGNKPKPGDRIAYLHVVTNSKSTLQGDKIEIPEYIRQNNLQIDYNHYITNQLMKPLMQLLGLAIEEIYTYKGKQREYNRVARDLQQLLAPIKDQEEQSKKREKFCSNMIRQLIFEPVLLKIQQKKMGLRDIRDVMFATSSIKQPMAKKTIMCK